MQTRLYGICYKATAPSGKAYIGQTASDFSKRKSAHRKDTRNPCPLHHALKKIRRCDAVGNCRLRVG